MVVVGSSRGNEEKLKCSGIGELGARCSNLPFGIEELGARCSNLPCDIVKLGVETCCAGDTFRRVFCLRIVFMSGRGFVWSNECVETVEKLESLVPWITGLLSWKYQVLIPVYLCGKCTKYRLPDGGLSLLSEVLVARVFEAPEFQTVSTVFLVGLSARRLLAVNLPQRVDNPPCLW